MTTYNTRIEHYGPGGLISTEDIEFVLEGEAEQLHLSPDRLRTAYAALRQWSADAQASYDDWPNKTNAQKDATYRETIRRLGVLMDRMADLLLVDGRS
jgi:hypothetical protein